MIVRSRAPVRITFGGGGTDLSPYDEEHGGLCLGATINRYSYCSLERRVNPQINIGSWKVGNGQSFENLQEVSYNGDADLIKAAVKQMQPRFGFEIYLRSDIQPHSGLGGSASACVAIIGAFNYFKDKDRLTSYQVAEHAFLVEQEELKNKGGRQDQYAAVFGGINFYEFLGGDIVRVNPVHMKEGDLLELEKNLLVVHVGERGKSSGEVHLEEFKTGAHTDSSKIEKLDTIKEIAKRMEYALRTGDLQTFGELVRESWRLKKEFNPKVTNDYVDKLNETALRNGAIGGRLMGAGGGGHMLFYCHPNTEQIVREKLEGLGAKVLDFSFDFKGLQTWEVN
jgi:D-glycero-alpha-D-manno-heptose-7-phosphate kinase